MMLKMKMSELPGRRELQHLQADHLGHAGGTVRRHCLFARAVQDVVSQLLERQSHGNLHLSTRRSGGRDVSKLRGANSGIGLPK